MGGWGVGLRGKPAGGVVHHRGTEKLRNASARPGVTVVAFTAMFPPGARSWRKSPESMREHFQTLARLLRESGMPSSPRMNFRGGSDSIADCAGGPERSEARREIEHVLIEIGTEQMRSGNVNPRTEMWLKAFTAWEQAGI